MCCFGSQCPKKVSLYFFLFFIKFRWLFLLRLAVRCLCRIFFSYVVQVVLNIMGKCRFFPFHSLLVCPGMVFVVCFRSFFHVIVISSVCSLNLGNLVIRIIRNLAYCVMFYSGRIISKNNMVFNLELQDTGFFIFFIDLWCSENLDVSFFLPYSIQLWWLFFFVQWSSIYIVFAFHILFESF